MKYVIRLTSLTALLLALLSGASLFWVSQQVQQVEREQRQLVQANSQEEESIRVLKAEWDYLNRPERLEELSTKYLNMAPVSADTMIQSISAIPDPEEPSMLPQEEKILEVSTSAPAKRQAPAPVKLSPPDIAEGRGNQEGEFQKVLSDAGATGQ
ncbi:MAG: energy transducer TonB [Micavibrio aeruginosavorus]|uniref:Energy transducer TonB n=1 Tax=Micavibrio aeruginosavorus TaxID=349221 RepID=A0A2W5HSX5_9BACT|nr:MAG: energy transducer TonB [Micavibrio aeruginosavorus]